MIELHKLPSAGQRLYLARQAASLEPIDVATAIKIGTTQVHLLELGANLRLPCQVWLDLADLYKVSVRWLLFGDCPMRLPEAA